MGSEESQSDAVRTVECLRGRLLAERVASKAAKEEADLMAERLSELERLLAAEVDARNRAEKRLDRALKKLESLKLDEIPGISEELRCRIAAASGAESRSSSASACSSATRTSSEERKSCSRDDEGPAECGSEGGKGDGGSQEGAAGGREREEDSAGGSSSMDSSVRQSVSEEDGDWTSVGTAQSVNNKVVDDEGGGCAGSREATDSEKTRGCGDSTADANSRQPSISSEERSEDDRKTEYSADDTLALVPAGIWLKSENNGLSTDNKQGPIGNRDSPRNGELYSAKGSLHRANSSESKVNDVLSALRLVKEQLRTSIDRRAFSVCSPAELCGQ